MNALKRGREKGRWVGPQIVGERLLSQLPLTGKGIWCFLGRAVLVSCAYLLTFALSCLFLGPCSKALQSSALNNQPGDIGLEVLGSRILVLLHALALHQVFVRSAETLRILFSLSVWASRAV